ARRSKPSRPSPCLPAFLNLIQLSILLEIELVISQARDRIGVLVLTQPLPLSPASFPKRIDLEEQGKKGPTLGEAEICPYDVGFHHLFDEMPQRGFAIAATHRT
ncbi:PREDICTED: PRUPE_1G174300, partial [Prunus dulcis]